MAYHEIFQDTFDHWAEKRGFIWDHLWDERGITRRCNRWEAPWKAHLRIFACWVKPQRPEWHLDWDAHWKARWASYWLIHWYSYDGWVSRQGPNRGGYLWDHHWETYHLAYLDEANNPSSWNKKGDNGWLDRLSLLASFGRNNTGGGGWPPKAKLSSASAGRVNRRSGVGSRFPLLSHPFRTFSPFHIFSFAFFAAGTMDLRLRYGGFVSPISSFSVHPSVVGGGRSVRSGLANGGLQALFMNHAVSYPTPANLSYFWGFGSLSAFWLGMQLLSGIFLAMHYTPSADLAFASVEHIMRDVQGGWFLRYLHANGASAFFGVVYLHMARGLLYRSFSYGNRGVWLSGMMLFLLMMATAFIGYVLPWGQMSFWGATVITNLFSVIPLVGPELVYWIWGGFSVGAATLNRFYSLHYLLPFLLAALVGVHLSQLHGEGSSNPFGLEHREIATTFHLPLYPYFMVKDLLGLLLFGVPFSYFLFFAPNALGHPDNYIEANAMVTPEHIVPEWYFLPFYAILRSIPNKTLGILAMAGALLLLFLLPLEQRLVGVGGLNPTQLLGWREAPRSTQVAAEGHALRVALLATTFLLLGFIGSQPVAEPYLSVGQWLTVVYFLLLLSLPLANFRLTYGTPPKHS